MNVPPSRPSRRSPAPRPPDHVRARRGDLADRGPIAAAQHRHDESVRRGHREPDVGGREAVHLLAHEVGVQRAVARERCAARLREHVRDRRLHAVLGDAVEQALPQLERPAHVDVDHELEDRDLPGLREAAGDRPRVCDSFSTSTSPSGAAAGPPRSGCRGSLDVLGHDPALGTGPVIAARSRPRSRAIRRASGDALMRPPSSGRGRGGLGRRSGSGRRRRSLGLGAVLTRLLVGGRFGHVLPSLPDHGDRLADLDLLALRRENLQQHPPASASTSWVTFSVSSS